MRRAGDEDPKMNYSLHEPIQMAGKEGHDLTVPAMA
jgi:hypothetical protein